MDDVESKIETEVAKYVVVPSSSSSVDGSDSAKETKRSSRKKSAKTPEAEVAEIETTTDAVLDAESTVKTNDEGFRSVMLNLEQQTLLQCVVGQDLRIEIKWKPVNRKELIAVLSASDVSADLEKASSENVMVACDENFTPVGDDLTTWRFIVAVTEEACTLAENQQKEEMLMYEKQLSLVVHKDIRKWKSLGSLKEVQEGVASNTRPLIELEISSKKEELMRPVNLQDRPPVYTSIGPGRTKFFGVPLTRIDTGIQAVPFLQSDIAQTDPGLPVNAWSQYVYDLETVQESVKETSGRELPAKYRFRQQDYLEKALDYNETLNLYTNDYPLLVNDEASCSEIEPSRYEPFDSLTDVSHCKGKVMSCICWHPMWSGIVAVAYTKESRGLVTSNNTPDLDSITDDVFRRNTVLIWSTQDTLQPKLILLSPSEVFAVKWCPIDGKILAGSCASGQIVLWDIEGCLEAVEAKEILTRDQERNRVLIRGILGWSPQTNSKKYVEATAISSLNDSHAGSATALCWLSPYHRVNAEGRYKAMVSGRFSHQIISCGEGGTVLIWDLDSLPEGSDQQKGHVIQTKTYVSRFKMLDGLLKPIYRFEPNLPEKRPINLTSISIQSPSVEYALCKPSSNDNNDPHELLVRNDYKPIRKETPKAPPMSVILGSDDAEILNVQWEGFDFDKGEAITTESAKIVSRGSAIHDGPITATVRSPFLNSVVLTVGGTVFALWHDSLPNMPFLWKSCQTRIVTGKWAAFRPSLVLIARIDGSVECWDLLQRSDKPFLVQSISGEPLTAIDNHCFGQRTLSIADYQNALKLFHLPDIIKKSSPNDLSDMNELVNREIQLRCNYGPWNNMYTYQNKNEIARRKAMIEEAAKQLAAKADVKEETAIQFEADEKKRMSRRKRLRLLHQQNALNLQMKEEELKVATLLQKKKLDRENLLSKQKPLLVHKQMDDERAQKRAEKMHELETKIQKTIATICPEIREKRVDDGPDFDEIRRVVDAEIAVHMQSYDEFAARAVAFVEKHKMEMGINLEKSLVEGSARRQALDVTLYLSKAREERYLVRKADRLANPPPPPSPPPSSRDSKSKSLALSCDPPMYHQERSPLGDKSEL